jgi:nitric oxide reductase NorQ protein
VEVFEVAWSKGLAIMLKGPTGCGKTRLVEHMAKRLDLPFYTISCHEDTTTADLVGRHLLTGGHTEWLDGPLTRAVREGGICYLDEVVEARQDTIVAIHSLSDHRRELVIERLGGEVITAEDGFCLVVSFNPGYQSVLKDMKMSTRQRMVSIELGFPTPEIEVEVVVHETGVELAVAEELVRLAQAIRRLEDVGLKEVASTRTLIAAAALVAGGLSAEPAAISAIAGPLTDDRRQHDGLVGMIQTYLKK